MFNLVLHNILSLQFSACACPWQRTLHSRYELYLRFQVGNTTSPNKYIWGKDREMHEMFRAYLSAVVAILQCIGSTYVASATHLDQLPIRLQTPQCQDRVNSITRDPWYNIIHNYRWEHIYVLSEVNGAFILYWLFPTVIFVELVCRFIDKSRQCSMLYWLLYLAICSTDLWV